MARRGALSSTLTVTYVGDLRRELLGTERIAVMNKPIACGNTRL
jgi:hypothetical protein